MVKQYLHPSGAKTSSIRQLCSCFSYLVVVTDEYVNGRQEQLKHCLLVTLLHLKTQPLQEARWTFGTLAAAVLEATENVNKHRVVHQTVFISINLHRYKHYL